MLRYAQWKCFRVWHPDVPEFHPALRPARCRKPGLAAGEQVSPSDSMQFSHPDKVLYGTSHISKSQWMSSPGSQPRSDLFPN